MYYDSIKKIMLKIFVFELTNLIDIDTLIIKIGQVNVSKSTKTSYFLLNRGINMIIANTVNSII